MGSPGHLPPGQSSSARLPEPRIQKATSTQAWQQHRGTKDAADVQDGQRPGARSRVRHLPGASPRGEVQVPLPHQPGGHHSGVTAGSARPTCLTRSGHPSPQPSQFAEADTTKPSTRVASLNREWTTDPGHTPEFRSRARRPGASESAGLLHPHPAPLTFPSKPPGTRKRHGYPRSGRALPDQALPMGNALPERNAAATRPFSSWKETHWQSQPGSKI